MQGVAWVVGCFTVVRCGCLGCTLRLGCRAYTYLWAVGSTVVHPRALPWPVHLHTPAHSTRPVSRGVSAMPYRVVMHTLSYTVVRRYETHPEGFRRLEELQGVELELASEAEASVRGAAGAGGGTPAAGGAGGKGTAAAAAAAGGERMVC